MPDIVISIVAHIDHGKTTIIDSIIAHGGRISKSVAGSIRYLDNREDEQIRGITLKLSFIKYKNLIFIDTPGHVDFESLIECSSILSDISIVVVDINEFVTPRTMTILQYIKNNSILIINKMDKAEEDVQRAVERINSLLKREAFSWKKNNIILCCATKQYGINYKRLVALVGEKKATINNGAQFLKILKNKVDRNDVEKIRIKYKLRSRNLLNELLPLAEIILDSIDSVKNNIQIFGKDILKKYIIENDLNNTNSENDIKEIEDNNNTILDIKNIKDNLNNLNIDDNKILPQNNLLFGISTYAIKHFDKILFVLKILEGKIKINNKIYSINNNRKESIIEEIYILDMDNFISVEEVEGATLCFIKADILKNSIITDQLYKYNKNDFYGIDLYNVEFNLQLTRLPLYRCKIYTEDIDIVKRELKMLSYTETNLKAKVNKFKEIEILCEGSMQKEKISNDLKEKCDIIEKDFVETYMESVTNRVEKMFEENGIKVNIVLDRNNNDIEDGRDKDNNLDSNNEIEGNKNSSDIKDKDNNLDNKIEDHHLNNNEDHHINNNEDYNIYHFDNNNLLKINKNKFEDIIINAVQYFLENGSLLNEKIFSIFIEILFIDDNTKILEEIDYDNDNIKISEEIDYDDNLYYFIRNSIYSLYDNAKPIIIPYFYDCKIFILSLNIYTVLQKYYYILLNEDYDEDTEFYVLNILIPRFCYDDMVEELKIKSKGCFYVKVREIGYMVENGNYNKYNHIVDKVRKEKGLVSEEKEEKQKILRKQ